MRARRWSRRWVCLANPVGAAGDGPLHPGLSHHELLYPGLRWPAQGVPGRLEQLTGLLQRTGRPVQAAITVPQFASPQFRVRQVGVRGQRPADPVDYLLAQVTGLPFDQKRLAVRGDPAFAADPDGLDTDWQPGQDVVHGPVGMRGDQDPSGLALRGAISD